MRRLKLALALFAVAILGLAIWAFWIEPASITVREHELHLPGWPQELAGLRVAALSDFHVGSPYNGIDKLQQIVALTNRSKPDLIVLLGDFVVHGVVGGARVPPARIAPVLSNLEAPLGVWAVLGNHDWWYSFEGVRKPLSVHGIKVLEDQAVQISSTGSTFWLVGIGDAWAGNPDIGAALESVPDDAPVLAITHNPDVFPEIPDRASLTVAGHTHGGQVALPLLGRPVVPSVHGQRYAAGWVVEEDRHLFVTPGLGTSIIPVRFLVPPEISLLKLYPARR